MIYLNSSTLTASINEFGAELTSLKDKITGKEYIWQGDPKYWTGHAPILFPAVGKVFEDSYLYKGRTYNMPKHGFAGSKLFDFNVVEESSVVMTLIQDEETRACFPFDYSFSIMYSLDEKSLRVSFDVTNEGKETMYCSLGFHPGYNINIGSSVEFEKTEKRIIYYLGETPITDPDKMLHFREDRYLDIEDNTFDGDKTIVIENPDSTKVVLRDENGKPFLKHEFGKNTVMWIWSVSGAPYICIEPWSGSMERFRIKELEKKNDIIKIDPGKKYVTESIISVF